MIKYRYSVWKDLQWSFRTIKNISWLKKIGVKIFFPNFFRMLHLCFKKPKTNFQIQEDIICYWIHAGTWGSYMPPNKIFICPWQIDEAGGLDRVIQHEVLHLKFHFETINMTHTEKEKFINAKLTTQNKNESDQNI